MLRPLTIFLGENSTGKTTTLACHQATHNLLGQLSPASTDRPFNQYPHSMGAFKDVFSKNTSRTDTARSNRPRITLTHELGPLTCKSKYIEDNNSKVGIESFRLYNPNDKKISLELKLGDENASERIINNKRNGLTVSIPRETLLHGDMGNILTTSLIPNIKKYVARGDEFATKILNYVSKNLSAALPNDCLVSFPARKDALKRSYHFVESNTEEIPNESLPQALFNLKEQDSRSFRKIVDGIKKFGQKSGIFDDFMIMKSSNDKFLYEFIAKRNGNLINIYDLGTGIWPAISQILAVELETLTGQPRNYHFQHIEEYSHPRLHAEMINWICEKINEGNNFVVETNSDYILMRLTIEICSMNILPDDVSIVYFENDYHNQETMVHNLCCDENGSVLNIPDSYRKFYYEETRKYVSASKRRLSCA